MDDGESTQGLSEMESDVDEKGRGKGRGKGSEEFD